MPVSKTGRDIRVSAAFNKTDKRNQEQDLMEGYLQDDPLEDQTDDLEDERLVDAGDDAFEEDDELFDSAEEQDDDDELMTIVDPLIDKAAAESDDSDQDEDLADSEFDDDVQFDEFLSDDPEDVDDLVALDDDPDLGDVVMDADLDGDLVSELKVPLTKSQQALEARRAIEARAEARRIERDLNYLDFELDD